MLPFAISPAETRLSWRSLSQGWRSGPSDFSGRLQSLLNAPCVLAGSGRALLHLFFMDLRARSGTKRDVVLIPGYTCYSVAAAAVRAGLRVAPYDLDPQSFQPDLAGVERSLSARTLAVIGQHLLGLPGDMAGLADLCRRHGVCLVEDAAQRLVFGLDDKDHGLCDAAMYSFGRGKPLPLGQGGALAVRDPETAVRLQRTVQDLPQGRGRAIRPLLVRVLSWPGIYWLLEKLPLGLGQTVYDPGFPLRAMDQAHQRIGAAALDELEGLNRHRGLISAVYARELGSPLNRGSRETPPLVRFPVLVDTQARVGQVAHLGLRRMYPAALCDLEALQPRLVRGQAGTPGAREIARRLVTLPTHTGVDKDMAMKIAREVGRVFGDIETVERE